LVPSIFSYSSDLNICSCFFLSFPPLKEKQEESEGSLLVGLETMPNNQIDVEREVEIERFRVIERFV